MELEKIIQGLQKRFGKHEACIAKTGELFSAAVLVPLVKKKGRLEVLFEVRSGEMTWQPNEVCFPGGRIEENDFSPGHAALRETLEELGLAEEDVELLGPLDFVVSPIGVLLYPYAGIIHFMEKIQINQREVAEIFTVPLAYLMECEPQIAHMEMATRPMEDFPYDLLQDSYPRDWKKRKNYQVQFYKYGDRVIWGLTAKVLSDFLVICRQENTTLNMEF